MLDGSPQKLNKTPRHVAIIMDGNGRWAKARHLPRIMGHKEGLNAVRRVVKACAEVGVEVLTLFAFSSENWRRPEDEIKGLLGLFLLALQNEVKKLHAKNVQVRVIGDCVSFGPQIHASILQAEQLTAKNTGLKLIIAADYGGRWDIVQATKKIAEKVKAGVLSIDAITENVLTESLSLPNIPEPDLLIRSSGEQRLSNFMIWQMAYTELYFTETFWPDFDAQALQAAFAFYASRERRFGYTGEQIEQLTDA